MKIKILVSFLSQSKTPKKRIKKGILHFTQSFHINVATLYKKHLYDPSYYPLHTTNEENPVRVIPSIYTESQSVLDAIIPSLNR